MSIFVVDGPLHAEQAGQDVDEDPADPGGHGVGLWGPEVDIQHNHSHTDTEIKNQLIYILSCLWK